MKNPLKRTGLSIVMKVSLLAGSIAAMASFIVGSLIVSGSAEIVYKNALNRLKYETNIKSLKLASDINNLSGDAQYLIGTPPIQGIPRSVKNGGIDPHDKSNISEWYARLGIIFSELIRAKPNYLQIRYIGVNNNGKELLRVERSGNTIITTPDKELQEKGNTEYFKKGIRLHSGTVYLSDISLNREFGKISEPHTPVIRAATPVYFEGKLFGILVINMAFGEIFNELIRKTPRELTPYITNEDGYFLAHPNNAMNYGFDLGNDNTIQSVYTDFSLKKQGDLRDIEFTIESNGDVIHVVKTYFDPENKDRFFTVMLATSYESLQSGSRVLRSRSFLIMALLVAISLVVAGFLVSRLMRPLQLITIASEDLAKGRDVSDLPVTAGDEIGELARSFDDMYKQLEDKERELIVSQGHVHHANKMASLGEMASNMAHEINSPIQAINLVAQRVQLQLKKDMSAEDINDSMDKITSSVKKISEIINSLKKISRGTVDDDFEDTRVGELVIDILNMTEERFRVNNIRFDISYHDISQNTLIQCQRLQISQVLVNLVNNAYDAIQNLEDKWVEIDIKKISEKIQISVTDSGAGIPDDVAGKMFEPMYTTKDVGKGTGLGLSISKDILLQHNGLIYVDKESKHTRLVIELPVVHINNS